jgi:hypothetical protein
MISKSFFKNYTVLFFCVYISLGCIFWFFSIDYRPSVIWFVISLTFYPILIGSHLLGHSTFQIFAYAMFLSHALASPLFFLQEDIFEYSGFSAVRDFDFSLTWYFRVYLYVFLFLYSTLFSVLLFKKIFSSEIKYLQIDEFSFTISKNKVYNVFLFVFLLFLAFLNKWMFDNGIGLTGIEPPKLPYRLSGILYFFSRFFAPLIILYLYSKCIRNYRITLLIIVYATWAAITSVSRTTLTMLWLPVIFFAILDKRYILLFSVVFLFFSIFPFIELARNYVYQIDNGVVGMNMDYSIGNIIWELFNTRETLSLKDALFGFIGRLGGTQDVILADQYNNESFASIFLEFKRVFLLSNEVEILKVQSELFGFNPPEGFSPGDGALSASILIISRKSIIIIIILSLFVSALLHFHELLLYRLALIFNYPALTFFLSLFFNMLFVPRLNFLWMYSYLFILFSIIYVLKITNVKKFVIKHNKN